MKDNELDAQVWLEGYVRGTVGEDGLTVFDLAELRDALTALCREYAASELERLGVNLDNLSGEYGVPYLNGGMSPAIVKAIRMDFVEDQIEKAQTALRVRADKLDGGK